jgi:hypothetical protein
MTHSTTSQVSEMPQMPRNNTGKLLYSGVCGIKTHDQITPSLAVYVRPSGDYINPLKLSGNYMHHLIYQSVNVYFYAWFLYGSHCKQRLFP